MSDKGIFDDAIYILGRYMDNRLRGKDASIRVLVAAGKIEKESTLAWIKKKAAAIAPNNTFYEPKTWLICKYLLTFLETLPEKED